MGKTCSTRGREVHKILVQRTKAKYRYEDLGIDGSIILKWIYKN
jgi:hypothetical protein